MKRGDNNTAETGELQGITCLCCGEMCSGKFCPNCGQSTSVGRLSFKIMIDYLIYGMFKMNGGLVYTVKELFIHPWKVVRDYIKGRRCIYMQPFILLLAMCLYYTIFAYFIPSAVADEAIIEFDPSHYNKWGVMYLNACEYLLNNLFVLNLFIVPPMILGIYLSYRKCGSKRYNWVEYVVAATFFMSLYVALDILTLPFMAFGLDTTYASLGIIIIYVFISLTKAFKASKKRMVWSFIKFIIYSLIAAVLYMIVFVLLHDYITTVTAV